MDNCIVNNEKYPILPMELYQNNFGALVSIFEVSSHGDSEIYEDYDQSL